MLNMLPAGCARLLFVPGCPGTPAGTLLGQLKTLTSSIAWYVPTVHGGTLSPSHLLVGGPQPHAGKKWKLLHEALNLSSWHPFGHMVLRFVPWACRMPEISNYARVSQRIHLMWINSSAPRLGLGGFCVLNSEFKVRFPGAPCKTAVKSTTFEVFTFMQHIKHQ
jgi:hypothetical protein